MVEAKYVGRKHDVRIDEGHGLRVISRPGNLTADSNEGKRDYVLTGIACRVVVIPEELKRIELHVQFLTNLAVSGVLNLLTHIDESTRERVTQGRILSLDDCNS
jgi:hypothetical protein